ncbi:MAG: T9SS type A sorting domain-containing protein [Bacteroidota bacterium]
MNHPVFTIKKIKITQSLTSAIFFLLCFGNADATILNVPSSYATIQSAINASANGDTILVQPATYFENLNFRGKNIFLTSLYYLNSNTSYISSTIINGSLPVNPDTASCVIFNSGEDSTAVLQGFTLTAGTGTKWNDIHGAGLFREGGGVLIELSSPSILHNIITNNIVTNTTGVASTGGGGIRVSDGNPIICSNIISFNQGRYGAGIVLNYTGCRITNNIIASNTGGQEFNGGSGIWIISNLAATPKVIVNNTMTNNSSTLTGGTGGILVWGATNVFIKNNIIWGNSPALQIKTISSAPAVTYSDIQGGFTGSGNTNLNPVFDSQSYFLNSSSPCIDAGDSTSIYNDIEDTGNPGNALFPSKGLLRNDIGAYGGPCTSLFPLFQTATAINEITVNNTFINIFPNPASDFIYLPESNSKIIQVEFYNITGEKIRSQKINSNDEIIYTNKLAAGIYFIKFIASNGLFFYSKVQIM